MTEKENALRIIKFNNPQYIMKTIPAYKLLYRGVNHQGYGEETEAGDAMPVGSMWLDIWGTGWHKEQEGIMGLPYHCPLNKPFLLSSYHWPVPDDERICSWIYEASSLAVDNDVFKVGSHRDTLWEKAYMLVGMEDLMVYFYTEPTFVKEVLHNIMNFQMGIAEHYLKAGVEIVDLGDDMGTQTGPLLNPEIIYEFFVPEYSRLFNLYKKHNVLINFHSCGNVSAFVDVLMELGADILNPVQATANDLDDLRGKTQGRMALLGGVRSAVLAEGPIESIIEEACNRMWQLGKNGGYFCNSDQYIPRPKEHEKALDYAIEKYGRYPLQKTV